MTLFEKKFLLASALLFTSLSFLSSAAAQEKFPSPQAAGDALVQAAKTPDPTVSLEKIFGPGTKGLLSTGDPARDQENRARFLQRISEKRQWVDLGPNHSVLFAGNDGWSFPVPLARKDKDWSFDVVTGRQEILNRRIGADENDAIKAIKDYLRAQQEYARLNPGAGGAPQYAQKFISDPGQKNGLYWSGPDSPVGPGILAAQAKDTAAPGMLFHRGYYFRILKMQGKGAAGGAKPYVKDGKMSEGFALIAYPAKWSETGLMTFLVNQDGKILEKNLGKETPAFTLKLIAYDPDKTWKLVGP